MLHCNIHAPPTHPQGAGGNPYPLGGGVGACRAGSYVPLNLKASSVLGHHEIPTNKRHDAQELPGEEAFQPRGIRFQIFVDIPQRISSHFARGSKRLEQVYLAACGFKQNLGTSLNSGRVP